MIGASILDKVQWSHTIVRKILIKESDIWTGVNLKRLKRKRRFVATVASSGSGINIHGTCTLKLIHETGQGILERQYMNTLVRPPINTEV